MVSTRPRRRSRHVDTRDLMAGISRLITACGPRVGQGTTEELATLIGLHDEINSAVSEAVEGLRAAGYTWDELGAVTGHTRQAALKKWNTRTRVNGSAELAPRA